MTALSLPTPPELSALLSGPPTALFLDFDGTLVDIAPTPDGIHVPSGLIAQLTDLAARLEGRLALVSGRAISDLEKHLGPISLAVAGSHGSDCRDASGGQLGEIPSGLAKSVLDRIDAFADEFGFAVEDKPHGAALHYRSDPSLEGRGLTFADELAAEQGLAIKRGKCVIELVARGADKAGAVNAFMQTETFAGATPLFVGDDVTDEDGMRAAIGHGGFGVAVGERVSENAKYALASPAAVHHWLEL